MTQPSDQKNIHDRVLSLITERKVHMRPASLFKIEFLAIALLSLIVLLISIALAGFIFFALRINGHEALLGFGASGIETFLLVFPWGLFVLDLLFIFFLAKLLREFTFGYRRPVLFVLAVLIVSAAISAFIIDRATPLHDDLREEGERGLLPSPIGDWYGSARVPAPHDLGIYRGVVLEVHPPSILMQHDDLDHDGDESNYTVVAPPGFDFSSIAVGDMLYVYGSSVQGEIRAGGIRDLSR